MSIFSSVDSGVKVYRSRFNLNYRHTTTCDYGKLIPIMAKFCLPGDVWRCGADVLARYQPMLSPSFTRSWIKLRYFFVPLRLIEPEFEKVVTGSDNGTLLGSLPVLSNFIEDVSGSTPKIVGKNSFWDYLGIPCMDYSKLTDTDKSFLPARYWEKAYARIYWDYIRDENFGNDVATDFETYYADKHFRGYYLSDCYSVLLPKDYFTSSLPWQLKGVAPTFSVVNQGILPVHAFQNGVSQKDLGQVLYLPKSNVPSNDLSTVRSEDNYTQNANSIYSGVPSGQALSSFSAADLRAMFAQTRVFERLARCGSRYTEYLRSNFNISPSDGTLQRAQYLGGFKQPIVCTEIAQTAQDGENAVGTLRGKGISSGEGSIKPYVVKEFGVILGLLSVMPEISYSQGIPREYTYKERFDFFNPSFQNLSEQEVRNAELYLGTDGKNSTPFGYQGYYNELRVSQNLNTSEMRDTLSFWNQGLHFTARPNLDSTFLDSNTYNDANSFHKPFSVQDKPPIIIDCMNLLDVYRPMVRRPVPGLIDHN